MSMMKVTKIPFEGYANIFRERNRVDALGKSHHDYHFGELCERKEDVPQYYELDCVAYERIGVAHIKIEIDKIEPK